MAVEIKQDQAYAYAELLEILSYTDIALVNKIPNKLMNIFKSYALPNYEKHINVQIPLEEQDISKKTASLIALLSLNYWCESEEEKSEIKNILSENEKIKEQKLREKYNPDNIFNNTTSTTTQTQTVVETPVQTTTQSESSTNLPMDYNKLPWYKKAFTSFRNFLLKIFKKQNNPT